MTATIEVTKEHTFTGHKDCLYTLEQISESSFVSSGADGMVVLWDLTKLTQGTIIAKVPNSVYALRFLPKQQYLIIGQNFEGLHILDVAKREEVGSLKLSDAAIFDIQVDGDVAYVAMGDGELFVIDIPQLRILKKLAASEKSARAIAITADEVFVGYSDSHIRAFDKASGLKKVREVDAHRVSVFTLQADKEGRRLFSGSRDAHFKVWDIKTLTLEKDVVAHMYAINHIAFSPDERHFVTCSMDKSIKVWDSQSLQLKKVIDKSRHAGHGTSVNKVLWMPFNNWLVSCSDDRSISVWSIKISDQ
ncbi:MAG: WD40 repeat protein [Cyclobacteriaceae bacterium]|jgi:WD40 repeat protein